jgi:hypothetical protein
MSNKPEVSPWQGGSFAGRMYTMRVGGHAHSPGGPNLGGPRARDEARSKAAEILAADYPGLTVDLAAMESRDTGIL